MNPAFPRARLRARAGPAARHAAPAARPAAGRSPRGVHPGVLGEDAVRPLPARRRGGGEGDAAADLAEFHARHYRPGNAELIVVGRRLRGRAPAAARGDARAVEGGPRAAAAPREAARRAAPGGPRREAGRAAVVPAPRHARRRALLARLRRRVGGLPGARRRLSSRLFRNLREEKGYTYGVYALGDARKLAGVSPRRREREGRRHRPRAEGDPERAPRLADEPVPARGARKREGRARARAARRLRHRRRDRRARRRASRCTGSPTTTGTATPTRSGTSTPRRSGASPKRYLDPAKMTVVMVANPAVVRPQLAGLPLGPLEESPPSLPRETAPPARAAGGR